MPRVVDHEDRRLQIVRVTIELIAEGGPKAVTMRAVARRLGGSVTLVTHYYPTRQAIFEGVAMHLIEIGHQEVAAMEEGASDPVERMRRYLDWALPTRPEAIQRELARIRLLAERDHTPSLPMTSRAFDGSMRDDLRQRLETLVPEESREAVVELLRVFVTGATLLAVEHQDDWTPERLRELADSVMTSLGLTTRIA
ncbi:TetR/AcrR family transcriptional regulator [Streptomyces sp. NPDC050625]|uniref:TetR/AcrR family transcriptional regulator n=1 Tax=Streptomyces sp. NPDC050625 TaxID=3154629 RepID=UPI00343A991A